jgi:Tfp pilus assembly protein PilO
MTLSNEVLERMVEGANLHDDYRPQQQMATELLQLRAQLAEAEADRRMLLNALRSQVVTAETQRQLLKEAV